jgi:T-complex protein 1 subunit gamma
MNAENMLRKCWAHFRGLQLPLTLFPRPPPPPPSSLLADGNAILREIDVAHPAAKSMLELSRGQDEEVGDGTTSVIILAGEMLVVSEPFLTRNMHPTVIVNAYHRALEAALQICDKMATKIDTNDKVQMRDIIRSCIGTKFSSRYGDLVCDLALEAVTRVAVDDGTGKKEIDIKRYAKVEKIPGGELDDCRVLDGVMVEKDVTHPRMRKRIENPRIVLLDCPLEYKKAESATNLEITKDEDFEAILKQEEEYIAKMCDEILALKPDLVITEKGVSDLASHYFVKAGVTAIRRVRKTDNLRIGRVSGATVVSRPDELQETDVGTGCGLFEIRKIGEEYFMFLEQCKDPKACTILLRGGSKDVLMEFERNLQDAMQVRCPPHSSEPSSVANLTVSSLPPFFRRSPVTWSSSPSCCPAAAPRRWPSALHCRRRQRPSRASNSGLSRQLARHWRSSPAPSHRTAVRTPCAC